MKILLAEDEKRLNQIITKYLQSAGYIVDSAFNGVEALELLEMYDYDLIIADIMMPIMDGFELIEKVRSLNNAVPILLLTARDNTVDKVKGLDMGADDYLIKPFEFEELFARIRALMRRRSENIKSNKIYFNDDIYIDLSKKRVYNNDGELNLTSKEYEILEFLVHNKGSIVSRNQIKEHVWDFDSESESNVIDVMIKNIRRKITDTDAQIIHTKRGMGYYVSIK